MTRVGASMGMALSIACSERGQLPEGEGESEGDGEGEGEGEYRGVSSMLRMLRRFPMKAKRSGAASHAYSVYDDYSSVVRMDAEVLKGADGFAE